MKAIIIKLCIIYIVFLSATNQAGAQRQLSEQEAVALAVNRSAAVKSADLQVQQSKQLQGAGINIPNPDVMAESPTGEFMTVGVLQSLSFPTVYAKQVQLAKQQTVLSQKARTLSITEISWQVKSAYLRLQAAVAVLQQVKLQDSLYNNIALSAQRQQSAGQADKVTQVYAKTQYGEMHSQYLQAQVDVRTAVQQIQLYTGLSDSIITVPLAAEPLPAGIMKADSNTVRLTPTILYMQQLQFVSQKSLELERHKALPGLSFGFLNQGPKNTPTDLRFRAGVNVPVWFWQYRASIKAAKTAVTIAEQNTLAQQQRLVLQLQQLNGDIAKYKTTLDYYSNTGLQQAEDLVSMAGRLFQAGQYDHITYMRTLSDACAIKLKYINALRDYKQSLLTRSYLQGE